jgi:hypothetical protein
VLPISPLRLVNRSVIVVLTTVIACLLPFFNAIVGLLGAIAFFPLTVYFPCQLHLVIHKVPKFAFKWWMLNGLCTLCLCVSLAAGVGSIAKIIDAVKVYAPFHSISSSIASGGGGH